MNNKLKYIKSGVKSNQQVLKNVTWLTVLQFANYLIPLLIIPYIVRVLGADVFGKVSYAQNIISYFTLVVNYGFEYTATRAVAINKGDKRKLETIFWSVFQSKTILLFISFVGLIALYFIFPKASQDFPLYLIIFLLNVGIVLFPTWFFQGVEEMGKMAVFNFAIKLLGLLLILGLVKSSSDYLLYPLFLSISYVICGFIAFLYVIKHYRLKPTVDQEYRRQINNESTPIFLNNVFVSLYTVSNITIFGFYYSDYDVGLYAGIHKIIMAILMLTSMPINMALFPRISSEFAISESNGIAMFKKVVKTVLPLALLIGILTLVFSRPMVAIILGNEFESSVRILRYLSAMPILVITASLFTVQGLYGMQLQRFAPYVGLSIGIISVALNFIFIPKYGIDAVAINWIIAQILEIVIVGYILHKHLKRTKP